MLSLVSIMLVGLPVAVWLDLRNITEAALMRQASDLNSVITSFRGFYATSVVSRVLAFPRKTQVTHNYESIPGAIPIPATLSLEFGKVVSEQRKNIDYRFVSNSPFRNRAPHVLDAFERDSLGALRAMLGRAIATLERIKPGSSSWTRWETPLHGYVLETSAIASAT